MGLDMYFYKTKKIEDFTYKQIANAPYYFESTSPTEEDYDEAKEFFDLTKEDIKKIEQSGITRNSLQEVAYFRKFNALHSWMVNNVQGGVDDCDYYEISRDQLNELLDTLHKIKETAVLVNWKEVNYPIDEQYKQEIEKYYGDEFKIVKNPDVCEDLLPTQDGFFFGWTLYDEYYIESVSEAIDSFERVSLKDDEVLLYSSSW